MFCKYNDYVLTDASGVNRVALLDPNSTQIDPHASAPGLVEMREVLTVIGPTPDQQPGFPNAVREWCINAPAVNPATNSVFFNNEDGRAYRWNLATNSLDQAIILNQGLGQPYVPTVIGPDGTVFTLNGGNIFALGNSAEVKVTIASSSPDSAQHRRWNSYNLHRHGYRRNAADRHGHVLTITYNGFTPENYDACQQRSA